MKTIQSESGIQGRILVVDDEPLNRELLRDLLEANDYTVIEAEDGEGALEKVMSEKCDVVLLDVLMPRMSGLDACRRMKGNLETAHIPVLMVTALTEREQRNLGIDAGANDYLTKPIDRRDVLLRVRNAVYAKRLYDKVQQDLAKLRELEALQDNLTHMIVHDMRSPLMIVSWSYDFLLKETSLLSPKQREYINMGQSCCLELVAMVDSLLDISRMESGQMPLNRTCCDLRDIGQRAAESVEALTQKKKVAIQVGGSVGIVMADVDITHRVFVNLLGNAIKFSPEKSTIRIDITCVGSEVCATVTDQGAGVLPEFHEMIFKKFGQVESRKKGQSHSFGLGLTFCKLAVESHGGRIGIDGPATPSPFCPGRSGVPDSAGGGGQGNTFWFTLPMAACEMEPKEVNQ